MVSSLGVRGEEEALQELAELALRLKESGLLDLLHVLADNYDDIVESLSGRGAVGAAVIAAAAVRGASSAPATDAARVVEICTRRLMEALAAAPREVNEVGPFGLLEALRDPAVRKGLGLLLYLARALGGCVKGES